MSLPDWLDREAWEGWVEMRKEMKRIPFTDRAQRIALKQLAEWHVLGYDTTYILEEATVKGWRGLFINDHTPRRPIACKPLAPSPQVSLINRAIEESQRTGEEADKILARWRAN
jgi:hypothetical protein